MEIAVADLVERVCHARGGAKVVASELDLSYSQLRRWAGDGGIPNLAQILRLAKLAGPGDPFRPNLINHLAKMFDPTPEELAERFEALIGAGSVTGREAADALRQVLRFVEIAPGRYARVTS